MLLAFSAHAPGVGYCQGMNFLAAMALLALACAEEAAFWLLAAMIDDGGALTLNPKPWRLRSSSQVSTWRAMGAASAGVCWRGRATACHLSHMQPACTRPLHVPECFGAAHLKHVGRRWCPEAGNAQHLPGR